MSDAYDSDDAPKGASKDGDDEETIVADAKKAFQIAEEAWNHNRRAALDDIRFARDEDQWPEKIRRDRELDGRPCLTLNQLHAFIFQVVNDARQNKPAIDVHPVGDGADVETAQLFNGLIRHIEQSSDGDVAYDTAMDFAVSGGFGFFRINTRYASDDNFDQDLILERIADATSVYPDPNSTAADSADWNQCYILHACSQAEWEKRWPDKDCVSFDGDPRGDTPRTDEEQYTYAEQWTREEVPRAIVALTAIPAEQMTAQPEAADQASELMGDELIVGADVYEEHKDLFDALGVTVQGRRDVTGHKVTQRFLSGAEVLEEVAWKGRYIPIVPVWGEEVNIEGKRVMRSLIRGAKDAQRMFNYWRTTGTELVALAPKAPFIGAVGQFATDGAKWANANTQTYAYLEYDMVPGVSAPPQRQQFAGVPAGVFQEAQTAQQDIMSIVGVYRSSLGAPSNETSAVAINARDKQADTGTFHFLDNLHRAVRHAGRILLDLIPKVYSTPRILRVLNPDGSASMIPVNQPAPVIGPNGQPVTQQDPRTGELKALTRIMDLTVGKYDLVVKAGPSFATQREQLVQMLTDLVRAYPPSASIVADIFVKNLDLPDADEIAKRFAAIGPQNPELQKAKAALAQLTQRNQQLEQQVRGLSTDRATDAQDIAIKEYRAETERFKAIAPQGVPLDMSVIMPVVLQALQQIAQEPDLMAQVQHTAAEFPQGALAPPAPQPTPGQPMPQAA